jgi:hypothetical protein
MDSRLRLLLAISALSACTPLHAAQDLDRPSSLSPENFSDPAGALRHMEAKKDWRAQEVQSRREWQELREREAKKDARRKERNSRIVGVIVLVGGFILAVNAKTGARGVLVFVAAMFFAAFCFLVPGAPARERNEVRPMIGPVDRIPFRP